MSSEEVRARVRELWRLRHELFMEELERRGVFEIPRDTLANKVERVARAWQAYVRSDERWREVVAKEPPEVRRAIAEILLSLMSLVYGHE